MLTSAGFGDVRDVLLLASEAWTIQGTYTSLVVWLLWWPAWFVATTVVSSSLFERSAVDGDGNSKSSGEVEEESTSPQAKQEAVEAKKRIYVKSVPMPEIEGGAKGKWNG
jgi:hypothetical protein